jgi:hypothetical protein
MKAPRILILTLGFCAAAELGVLDRNTGASGIGNCAYAEGRIPRFIAPSDPIAGDPDEPGIDSPQFSTEEPFAPRRASLGEASRKQGTSKSLARQFALRMWWLVFHAQVHR